MKKVIIDLEKSAATEQLKTKITSMRQTGQVLFEIKGFANDKIKETENITTIIDTLVTQMGCTGIGDRWKEIGKKAAEKIIIRVLTKDLAYSSKIGSSTKAAEVLAEILNFFPGDRQFFTNALFSDDYSEISSWDSITQATFDTGVVIVSDRKIGILWVKDED